MERSNTPHAGLKISVNPLTTNVPPSYRNQSVDWQCKLTGFYMMGNIDRLWVKEFCDPNKRKRAQIM